jgi:hypothetical protein
MKFLCVMAMFCSVAWGQVVNPPKGNAANFSCTPGVASGTGATCVCATNHSCTTNSGVLTVVTGSGTTSGLALTVVLYGAAQPKWPNCVIASETASAFSTAVYTAETSTGFNRVAWSAPAYPATYTVHYQCGY